MDAQIESSERQQAPGRLSLVQELINSYDIELAADEFDSSASLAGWLADRGLLPPGAPLDERDLERARAFREALRTLLDERAHGEVAQDTLAALDRISRDAVLRASFERSGTPRLRPAATGLDSALAELLAIIGEAAQAGTWARLKVCAEDTCLYAFYDRSKNRSGAWCSMAACGNRAKARNYRRRHRPDGA